MVSVIYPLDLDTPNTWTAFQAFNGGIGTIGANDLIFNVPAGQNITFQHGGANEAQLMSTGAWSFEGNNVFFAAAYSLDQTDQAGASIVGSRGSALALLANANGLSAQPINFLTQNQATAGLNANSLRLQIKAGAPQGLVGITCYEPFALNAGLQMTVNTVSANTTLTIANEVVLANATSAPVTVTLPAAASGQGSHIIVIKIDSSANVVTVSRAGSDTIQGLTTKSLTTQYTKAELVSDGVSTWYDLGANLI